MSTVDYSKQVFSDIEWGFHITHGSGIKCRICLSFDSGAIPLEVSQ